MLRTCQPSGLKIQKHPGATSIAALWAGLQKSFLATDISTQRAAMLVAIGRIYFLAQRADMLIA